MWLILAGFLFILCSGDDLPCTVTQAAVWFAVSSLGEFSHCMVTSFGTLFNRTTASCRSSFFYHTRSSRAAS